MKNIFVYVTVSSEEEAKKIAKLLLEKELIGCANFFPIQSIYQWEGSIKDDKEWVLILKADEVDFEVIKKEVEQVHSYDTPCIAKLDVELNEKYAKWLNESKSSK